MARKAISRRTKQVVFEEAGWRCVYCDCELIEGENATVEHILQLYKGGTDVTENLTAACGRCNSGRGGRTFSEHRAYIRNTPLTEQQREAWLRKMCGRHGVDFDAVNI